MLRALFRFIFLGHLLVHGGAAFLVISQIQRAFDGVITENGNFQNQLSYRSIIIEAPNRMRTFGN